MAWRGRRGRLGREHRHPSHRHRVVLRDQTWVVRTLARTPPSPLPTSGVAQTRWHGTSESSDPTKVNFKTPPVLATLIAMVAGPATAPRTWMATKWSASPTSWCCSPTGATALPISMVMAWLPSATCLPCSRLRRLHALIRNPTGLSDHAQVIGDLSAPLRRGFFFGTPDVGERSRSGTHLGYGEATGRKPHSPIAERKLGGGSMRCCSGRSVTG